MKRYLSYFLLGVLVAVPVAVVADSATDLISLGMPSALSRQISTKLVNVNSSGNLVLPAASAKKLSVTVAGTEEFAVSANGLNIPTDNYEASAGAGTNQATGTVLTATKQVHRLTGANGTVAWTFATPAAGDIHILLNTTAGVANIYPQSGGTINGASADAVFNALTGIKPIICYASSTTAWICA